jgi:hypothetical protein
MSATTLFTWGYYGSGNATPQFVESVDAAETSRGFEPPIFVDIRIRRSVRAKGFQGSAFERLLGPLRHRWMKSLGNNFIESRSGPNIQIADPSAAGELLDLALDAARARRRLLFFCSCQWPRYDGEIACHRATVAGLVLKTARKRDVRVEVVEWPGGKPQQIDLGVTPLVFAAVRKGRMSVPLGNEPDLAEVAALPWCSIATLHADGHALRRVVGPAIRQPDQWVLPILYRFFDEATGVVKYQSEAEKLRRSWGLEPSSSGDRGS